jgi:hypothetical protein
MKIIIQSGNPEKLINVSPTSFYFPERYILHPKLHIEFIETLIRDIYVNDKFSQHFYKDNTVFIITNSEHIINRCRIAKKDKEIENLEIQFFPFYENEYRDKNYIKIETDKNGEFNQYPKDFMDEWFNQLSKLI